METLPVLASERLFTFRDPTSLVDDASWDGAAGCVKT